MSWNEVPMWSLYRRVDRSGRPDLPLLSVYRDHGVVRREGREDNYNKPGADLFRYKIARKGDLVINKMKTWQGSLGVSSFHGIVSPAYFVANRIGDADDRFMHHLLRSQPLIAEYGARSKGIRPAQWDLPWDEFASIKVRLPHPGEQREIADYLDIETGRIDALTSKKRRMIDILTERRQAVITAAVTGDMALPNVYGMLGHLDQHPTSSHQGNQRGEQEPGGPDSDSACSGNQLSSCPLKHLVDLNDSGTWGEDPTGTDDVVVLRSTDIGMDGSWRIHAPAVRRIAGLDRLKKRLACGDIVVVKSSGSPGHLGKAAIVTKEVAAMSPSFANFVQRLRPSSSTNSRYIWYVLNSKCVADEMASLGNTTTGLRNLNGKIIGSVAVPVTRFAEQRVIADYLDIETGRIDTLISKTHRSVDLLTERRQALITAAVTGRLAIPGVVA